MTRCKNRMPKCESVHIELPDGLSRQLTDFLVNRRLRVENDLPGDVLNDLLELARDGRVRVAAIRLPSCELEWVAVDEENKQ